MGYMYFLIFFVMVVNNITCRQCKLGQENKEEALKGEEKKKIILLVNVSQVRKINKRHSVGRYIRGEDQ